MITLLLVILIVLALSGGFYGYRTGYVTYGNPIGLILLIVVVLLILGLFSGPFYYHNWW